LNQLIPKNQFEKYNFPNDSYRTYGNSYIKYVDDGSTSSITNLSHRFVNRFNNYFEFDVTNIGDEQRNVFVNLMAKDDLPINSEIEIVALFIDNQNVETERELDLTYGKAHDPNNLIVNPTCIQCKNVSSTQLRYTVNFQNNGNGEAKAINVKIKLPDGINPNSVVRSSVGDKNFKQGYSINNNTSTPGEITFEISDAFLRGFFEDDTENYDETTGSIDFSIPLSNSVSCNKPLEAQAFIIFDVEDPIATNVAATKFGNTIGFKSKNIKLGADYSLSKSEIGGFFGLTMKPECSKEWYNQFELMAGYSRYKCDTIFSSCHIYNEDNTDTNLKIYELNSHNINLAIAPIHIRKEFSSLLNAGIGAELRTIFKFGEFYSTNTQQQYNDFLLNFDSSLFADVNLNLGGFTIGARYLYGFELLLSNSEVSGGLNNINRTQAYLQFKL